MKKLLFILLIFAACRKNTTTPNSSNQNNPPQNTVVQDSRFLGKWIVDSVLYDSIMYTINPSCELGDSMLITLQKLTPYEWTGLDSVLYGTWETLNGDSLIVHYYNGNPSTWRYRYIFKNSTFLTLSQDSITVSADKQVVYYHKH